MPDLPLVDRTAELDTLGRLLASADDARPALAVLTGETGIGKSRLVRSFGERSDVRMVAGACFPTAGDVTPYTPFAQAFRNLARDLDPDGRDRLAWCWPHELAALGREPGPTTSASQGRLFESVLSVLGELTRREAGRAAPPPAALVLEDLHWADNATLDLLSFLARNLRDERVLLVLTLRTDRAHPSHLREWYAELTRLDAVTVVAVPRLTPDQTGEYLTHLLQRPVPPEEVERVHAQTAGNPLFTEQALPWLLDRTPHLPESLRELVTARVAALPPDTRTVLDVLAVLGRSTGSTLLAQVAGRRDAEVEAALRPALDHQLLMVDHSDGCSFTHPLLGEVIDGELLPGERRRLHDEAARALTTHQAGIRDPREAHDLLGRIARHRESAGQPRLAFEASVAAALAAGSLHATAAGDEHFARAVALLDVLDELPGPREDPFARAELDRADLYARAAQAAHLVGDGARAVGLADRAVAACSDPVRLAAIWERKGQICVNALMPVEAEAAYDAALALLPADGAAGGSEAEATRVRALTGRANLLVSWSRFDDADAACAAALRQARAGGHDREVGRALMAQGLLHAYRGRLEEGAELLLASLDIARRTADAHDLAYTLINTTHVLCLAARYDECVRVATVGYEELRLVGLARQDGAFLHANAVDALLKSGRWDDAETLVSTATEHRPRGARAFPVLLMSSRLALLRGDLDEAARRTTGLERLAAEHDLPGAWVREMQEVAAALAWWDGHPDVALDIARTGLDQIALTGEQVFAARLAAIAARALGDLSERDGTQPDVDLLVERLRSMRPDPLDVDGGVLPDSRAWSSTLVAELTRARRASDPRAWARAASAWDEAGERYPWLYARWRHAEALVMRGGGGEETARAVRESHAAARETGAGLVVAELDKLARWARIELRDPAEATTPEAASTEYGLTGREWEVLAGLVAGRTNRELADVMFISTKTASVHVSNILRKLDVANRQEAARIGHRLGLS